MKKHILLILLLTLAGCSNLAMTCQGTYTGNEVRNVRK